ncbi:MAG: PilZ domain-containing protein [Candidatus Omnitrophota bacterium]
MDERRSSVRWNISLPIRYMGCSKHNEGFAHTRDLSTTGACVETVEKHKAGDHLNVMLEFPGDKDRVCIDSEVVWQKASQGLKEEYNYLTGLVFRKIRDSHKQCILDYVIDSHPDQLRNRWWQGLGA